MKLNKRQKNVLLEWIAEGLATGEINKRASKFRPAFKVTRQQVDFYRKTRNVHMQKIKQEDEFDALHSGLALREKRVELLQNLAELLRKDLLDDEKLWTDMEKGLGLSGTFKYKEFNAAEVQQLRGILDDIATEVNERVKRQEVTGKNGAPLIPASNFDFSQLSDGEIDAIDKAVSTLERVRSANAPLEVGNRSRKTESQS